MAGSKPVPTRSVSLLRCSHCDEIVGYRGPLGDCRCGSHFEGDLDMAVRVSDHERVPVEYVPLDDVIATLEYAYAPQNPTVHHPADWIAQHYGKAPNVIARKVNPS